MAYGDGDEIRDLSENQCNIDNVRCTECGRLYDRCHVHNQCPGCGGKKFDYVPWWYGMSVPGKIHGKTLLDGRKIIPRFFVEVRAFLNPHPGGDNLISWIDAEKWFKDQGYEWVEEKEWYSYSKRISKDGNLYFRKEE